MSGIRSLPRLFVDGATASEPFELPKEEVDKLRKVLRLAAGAEIAVLPNDGTLLRCRFEGHNAVPLSVEHPDTESPISLRVAQALPKGDKLDEIVRACTELGVSEFCFFASERSVVRWEASKLNDKLRRLQAIAREAAEVSFRTRLPKFSLAENLADVMKKWPKSIVLSESEMEFQRIGTKSRDMTIVVGPEGGWTPRELQIVGVNGVTLGPRVLRVDHAAPAAAAMILLA